MFRSLQEDWSYFDNHSFCSHNNKTETGFSCFLCFIRNLSNRICKPTKQTRKIMQPIEIISQLEQFKSLVKYDFKQNPRDTKMMLEKTIELMNIYEPSFLEENKNLKLQCSSCKELVIAEIQH